MKRTLAWVLMFVRGFFGICAVVQTWNGEWWDSQVLAVAAKTTQAMDVALTGSHMAKKHRLLDDITNGLMTVPISLMLLFRKPIPQLWKEMKGRDIAGKGTVLRENLSTPWIAIYGLIETTQLGLQIGRSRTGKSGFAEAQSGVYHLNDGACIVALAERATPLLDEGPEEPAYVSGKYA